MTTKMTVEHTCDRCKTKDVSIGGGELKGWSTIEIRDASYSVYKRGDLCPVCTAAVVRYTFDAQGRL